LFLFFAMSKILLLAEASATSTRTISGSKNTTFGEN
jgi:hypothetical protein